ncbi:stalk domain-containing protein [Saccharibacillus brassicae]|uniref:Copper amine oxidase-like N-terminal domain-containing protein n=1 Tax=Saccharibacillus brassicae TaxID=2583377 RepID=A0A4Y6UPI8_SACBS|nr:hypothetical protein [Saccharibacillus brassicae]QDH19543.1 hypothetical protein FFV09_00935 [Saccharibacillus brassicae]
MKKTGKIAYVLSGVVLGVAITSTAPTLAATVSTITAKLHGDVKVVVDGKTVGAKPINYDNQKYLPVGDIGRALGASVKFDKVKNSIVVTGKDAGEDTASGAGTGSSGTADAGGAVSSLDPVADNSNLKAVYAKGEQINFANSTFKVVSIFETIPWNDQVDRTTIEVEVSIDKMQDSFPLRHIDFIEGVQTIAGAKVDWTGITSNIKALPYNQPVKDRIVLYTPISDTSIQLKVTDPTQRFNANSKRTANAPTVLVNIK